MTLTPEQREEIAKAVAANRATQAALSKKQRGDVEEVTITLVSSADDPPPFSDEYQAALERVSSAFHDSGIKADATIVRMDSAEDLGGLIGEFIIPVAKVAPAIVAGIVGAWLREKLGRKARAKVGDIELEAPIKEAMTTEEFEQLLHRLIEAQSKTGQKKR